MATLSREHASGIVEGICNEHGGIRRSDREKLRSRLRDVGPGFLSALGSTRELLGNSTKLIATYLYKHAQFIFELIQNAKDNEYDKAKEADEKPFLVFTLYPDKIIIDSNEDGFNEDNVRYICQVEKRTKKHKKGCIGERGIGFNSVFKIVSVMHIQLGPFSYFFEHKKGESGMGMLTPFYQDPDESLPSNICARIKLDFAPAADRAQIDQDFSDLPDSFLMFLEKLRKITVTRFNEQGLVSKKTCSYHYEKSDRRGTLTNLLESDLSSPYETVIRYHLTKKSIRNLPKDAARPETETVKIVLADPLDSDSVPIIKQQHVFAYLPVRNFGFSFQIQSDFTTTANRGAVTISEWNETILAGVAETFRDAVLQFCQHPTLQFHWMRYLPSKDTSEPFRAKLLPKVVALLKETPILRPRSGGALKRPHQLKWQASITEDEYHEPLFADLPEELYLSQGYLLRDKQALDQLGVQIIDWGEVCARIRADLDSPSSMMRSVATSDDWHNRSAKFLMCPIENNWPSLVGQVRQMCLIPLHNHSWVSCNSGSTFFPYRDKIPIPTDLSLQLVEEKALKNVDRKALFSKLGVKNCLPEDVVPNIIKRYTIKGAYVTLQSSVMHLRYLYWKLPKGEKTLNGSVYVMDQKTDPVYYVTVNDGRKQKVDDLYFESRGEYGPKELLSKVTNGEEILAPGYPAHFIKSAYLLAVSTNTRNHYSFDGLSWLDWLERFAKVQRIPRLVKPSSTVLSDVFLYIIEHRRNKLVGTLKEHWDSYSESDTMNPEIRVELSKARVTCEYVADTPLEYTYMPLPKLKKTCDDFGVDGKLPFLKLPVVLSADSGKNWKLSFYLDILRHLVRLNSSLVSDLNANTRKHLFTVYEAIEKYRTAADDQRIRDFFREERAVYVPGKGSHSPVWVAPFKCVWKAPDFFDLRHSLASADGYLGNKTLEHLFNTTLHIGDADYGLYIEQIEHRKKHQIPMTNILDIYRQIYLNASVEDDWACIRDAFEEKCLILVLPQADWHRPSSCLWTENTRISGKAAIAGPFMELKEFFVRRLRVETPNISMFVEELKRLTDANEAPPILTVVALIKEINSLGPREETLLELKLSNILPVKGTDGVVSLRKPTDIFAIADRLEYENAFRGKVSILAFGLEAVHELRPFLSALRLGSRYMSHTAEETTTVNVSLPNPVLSADIKFKAYALFRCAVHYGSPRSRNHSLHRQLLGTNVYESQGIFKTITINLEGTHTSVQGAKANLHVEDDTHFRFYVPQDPKDRERCYLTQLPRKLVTQLSILDQTAVKVFGDVLNARLSVDDILSDYGVVQVQGIERMNHLEPIHQPFEDDVAALTPAVSNQIVDLPHRLTPSTPTRASSLARSIRSPTPSPRVTSRSESSIDEGFLTPRTHSNTRSFGTPRSSLSPSPAGGRKKTRFVDDSRNDEYHKLLDNVINAAAVATFPAHVQTASATAPNVNPIILTENVFGRRSENQMSHDVKIGAAGELYVFELLLRQGLPGFGRSNWQSTVRKKVCVHEKYRDMEPWKGAETADIVYEDQPPHYGLTRLLFDNGHLPGEVLSPGATLKYFLEVKTTTKGCESRFFVSRAQLQRMQRMALDRTKPATEIYIILCVFNLGQDNIGMRLYVDPATMERNGQLKFNAASYIVTPGAEIEDL